MKVKLILTISFSIITILSYSQSVKEYYNLGLHEIDAGNNEKAIQYFDKVIKLDKLNIDAYSMRGYLKAQNKNFKGAIIDFSEIIKIAPKNTNAYSHRGICNKEIGDYKAALKDYDSAIALDKKNAHAYHNRAIIKFHFLSDKKGACKDWDIAKRLGLTLAYQYSEGKCEEYGEVIKTDNNQTARRIKYKTMAMSKSELLNFIKKNYISFAMPKDFEEVKIIANSNMPYHYAIKNKNADFELRIYIESLTDLKKEFKTKGIKDVSINNLFERRFLSSLDNISQAQPQYLVYDAKAVVPKFNGSIGLFSHFDYSVNSEYGKGYKHGTFMVIHKDNIADLYLSFLYNNNNNAVFKLAEKTLRFK